MNEACINLLQDNIGSFRGKQFALEVMDFMRAKIVEFQKETGNNYNLEATPGEGTSYRLAKLDKERYPYYTNSTQLPVNYTDDILKFLTIRMIYRQNIQAVLLCIFMQVKEFNLLKL